MSLMHGRLSDLQIYNDSFTFCFWMHCALPHSLPFAILLAARKIAPATDLAGAARECRPRSSLTEAFRVSASEHSRTPRPRARCPVLIASHW